MVDEDGFDISGFLPYLLNQAAEASSRDFQQVYKARYGLLRTEWRVLFHLGRFGTMTARDLSQRAALHKTKVSRAVHKLATRRYLSRQRNDRDKRSEFLALTPLGDQVFRDLKRIAADYDHKLVAGLPPDEVEVLRSALRRLAGMK